MLEDYLPKKYGDQYRVSRIFQPDMEFQEKEFSLIAATPRARHIIYSIQDVMNARGKLSGAKNNFKGLIGERILSAVLDELVNSLIQEHSKEEPGKDVRGSVLREEKEYEGKGYAVTYNNKFLLRYHGKTNFFVLSKRPLEDPDSWYQQERLGLTASEIDGLAYLHIGQEKYLFIGEVKTITSWKNIGDSNFFEHIKTDLFPPFRSLFPRHELVFAFLGRENILFEGNKLKKHPFNITESLQGSGVSTLYMPFPKTPKTLERYAEDMYKMLPLTRKILESIGEI